MSANEYDVIIIGAGLGGLQCAYILAKHGQKVLVLEQDALLGGCLQTFRRDGHLFDTGFHYVGGLDNGQMLHRLFDYFNLLDLPWHKLDPNFFDEVVISGQSYRFVNGFDNFQDEMSRAFPACKDGIATYVDLLRQVGKNIEHSFDPRSADDVYQASLFARSAYDFLTQCAPDPRLHAVLSGTSLKLELQPATLPLYIFGQINSSFIQSAYRIHGGGMQIADTLASHIESMGGRVIRRSRVTAFENTDGLASAVFVNNGQQRFSARYFIADTHPAVAVNLLHEAGLVRKIYNKRISNLQNTFGMLTVNIVLRPNSLSYLNRNVYIYPDNNVWNIASNLSATSVPAALVSFAPPPAGQTYASVVDVLVPMDWTSVSQWFGTKIGDRGNDYVEFKDSFAHKAIDFVSQHIAGFASAVDKYYVSTPLTYADYTSTASGSAYGIRKDYNQTMYTILTPKTPVPNVFLTGQNLNLHGVLGTSMTSFFSAAEILGMDTVRADLNR